MRMLCFHIAGRFESLFALGCARGSAKWLGSASWGWHSGQVMTKLVLGVVRVSDDKEAALNDTASSSLFTFAPGAHALQQMRGCAVAFFFSR